MLAMETFAPELAAQWLDESEPNGERRRGLPPHGHESLTPSQKAALEELADRISAARSVV